MFFLFFLFLYFLMWLFFLYSFDNLSCVFEFFFFSITSLDLVLGFIFDYLSLGFFGSVSFISFVVFFYSFFYMEGTVDYRRFWFLVFGFVFSMFFLVFSANFFLTLIGWDGLGLISFYLVVFYPNHFSMESGLLTVFSNRIGDVFFLSCFFFFILGGSFLVGFNFFVFFVFLFLGCITKSAQLPFFAWLPAAMAAPTPVSSLVHSSTLVTAGVYVLVRFNFLFEFLNFLVLKVFFLGTMIVGGMCAVFESDFKKIVAMSTLSQLGLMMFIFSIGVWVFCFLHMVIHAFFKSMLFLGTGSLMFSLGGGQDSRFYGGDLMSYFVFLFFLVSVLCLVGFPFYIGFYSKDFIILGSSLGVGLTYYLMFLFGCVLTVVYSLRLVSMSFSGLFEGNTFCGVFESFYFFMGVIFLFYKGFFMGGLFYWFFLWDVKLFMSGLDVVLGLLLLVVGFFFFSVLFFFRVLMVYMFFIFFVRWFSTGGSSSVSKVLTFKDLDSSWLELIGGQGMFLFIWSLYNVFRNFMFLGLGVLFMVFVIFYF